MRKLKAFMGCFLVFVLIFTLTSQINVFAATTETSTKQAIIADAKKEAIAQRDSQNYSLPPVKVNYKILYLALENVILKTSSGNKRTLTMTNADRTEARRVATEFTQCIREKVPNVNFTVDYATVSQTLNCTSWSESDLPAVELSQELKKYIESHYSAGSYDLIVTTSHGDNHGGPLGETAGAYSIVNGAAHMRGLLSKNTSFTPSHSTIILMHEICHVLSFIPDSIVKGDVHGASNYGYTSNSKTEWLQFYTDYLNGKLRDSISTGKYIGAFPKMWQISPRFMYNPAKLEVNYVNTSGTKIASTAYFYGVGGDTYNTTPPSISGYNFDSSRSDSTTGTLETAKIRKITFVYNSGSSNTSTFSSGILAYRPNNLPDLDLDNISSFTISSDYKNRNNDPWFDIFFRNGSDAVNAGSIKSSNSNVAQFRNYDNNIARFNVKGAGTAELSFTSKDGRYTYKKTVVVTSTTTGSTTTGTGLQQVNGKWYYYQSNGSVLKGSWMTINGYRYFFNGSTGAAETGWMMLRGYNIYFDTSGRLAIGWQTINGAQYYFDSNGYMATGNKVISGTTYRFDSNGKYLGTGTGSSTNTNTGTTTAQTFSSGRLAYRPNGLSDLSLDSVSSFTISSDYKNKDGNPWFDIVFGTGAGNVNAGSIKSSNNNVVQFRNYDNNIARFNVKGAGTAELSFTSKDGKFTYKKTVVVTSAAATATFGAGRLIYRPNGLSDLSLDSISSFTISRNYKNAYGSPWFDIFFGFGTGEINASSIKSSNNNVIQFRNFDGGVARFNVRGVTGTTEISFTSRDGRYTYKKTVIVN